MTFVSVLLSVLICFLSIESRSIPTCSTSLLLIEYMALFSSSIGLLLNLKPVPLVIIFPSSEILLLSKLLMSYGGLFRLWRIVFVSSKTVLYPLSLELLACKYRQNKVVSISLRKSTLKTNHQGNWTFRQVSTNPSVYAIIIVSPLNTWVNSSFWAVLPCDRSTACTIVIMPLQALFCPLLFWLLYRTQTTPQTMHDNLAATTHVVHVLLPKWKSHTCWQNNRIVLVPPEKLPPREI